MLCQIFSHFRMDFQVPCIIAMDGHETDVCMHENACLASVGFSGKIFLVRFGMGNCSDNTSHWVYVRIGLGFKTTRWYVISHQEPGKPIASVRKSSNMSWACSSERECITERSFALSGCPFGEEWWHCFTSTFENNDCIIFTSGPLTRTSRMAQLVPPKPPESLNKKH